MLRKGKLYLLPSILYRLFLSLSLLLSLQTSFAQDCGCTNCPQNVFANGNTVSICYEVTNADNDNLADPAQGICGVELVFEHERVQNLEIALVSPDGQLVQLIGPHQPFGLNGFAQSFQVSFVHPDSTAVPDDGHSSTWDNEDFTASGGTFTGSYYPFQGSLSNFNNGVVNGTWCLEVINHDLPPGFNGTILDFNIILCDQTGQDCCFANGGELLEPDTVLCEGNEYLDYSNLQPTYSLLPPDEEEYDYAYVISEDGIILEYNPTPNLTSFPAGNYQICGLSYRTADAANFPEPNGSLTTDELRDDLNSPMPPFCGNVTDDCINIRIVAPNEPTAVSEEVCEGDTLFIDGMPFFIPGNYEVILPGYAACDSIIQLELSLIEKDTTFMDSTICELDIVLVGDSIYNQTGAYMNVLISEEGCDSLVFLNLTVEEHAETIISETICPGDCYEVGDSCYTETGLYNTMLSTEAGCDSLVLLNLLVLEINAAIAEHDSLGCEGSTVTLDGSPSGINSSTTFQWYFENNPIPGADNSMVSIADTGMYWLVVEHPPTGCTDTAMTQVFENKVAPIAAIARPDTLNCLDTSVILDGSPSTGTAPLSYFWETQNGTIEGANNAINANVSAAETYSLIVTGGNFCKDTTTIIVEENIEPPTADAGLPGQLNCAFLRDTLDGTNSSTGPFMEYLWQTDTGNIVAGANSLMPIINADGLYILTVTDTQNHCSASSNVFVNSDFEEPVIQIADPDELDCVQTSVVLDATDSDSSDMFLIEWQIITGNLLPNTVNTLQPIADEPGIYELQITNTSNNCSNSDVVEVSEQVVRPNAVAITNGTLNCDNNIAVLDASNSSSNGANNLIYQWTDANGVMVGDMETVEVSASGTYFLQVINDENQCSDLDSTIVQIDTIPPFVEAGIGFELDCNITAAELNGAASPGMDYLWTGPGIVADTNTLNPLVNQAGWYYLSVRDESNGCMTVDSVEVTQDTDLPMVDAGETDTLNCVDTCLILNALVTPNSSNFVFEWEASNGGNIKEGSTTLAPFINEAGTYTLIVRDTSNNCTASDMLVIVEDTMLPTADAGENAILTCIENTHIIGSNNSSSGNNISYEWTTLDGFLEINEVNILQPEIDSAGTYQLTVFDNNNNCQTTDEVTITSNQNLPTISVTEPDTLNCSVNIASLDASSSIGIGNLIFHWTTNEGIISNGQNMAIATAEDGGFYQILVEDEANGCQDSMIVEVVADASLPNAITEDSVAISCFSGRVRLEGLGSSEGSEFVYEWIPLDNGMIESGQNELAAEASAIGDYLFIVTDTLRNCADSSLVTVTEDCTPVVDAFADIDTINCIQTLTMLHGEFEAQGGDFSFYWYLVENDEIVDSTQLDLEINQGGTYVFIVTNNELNTTGRDTVYVEDDRELPIANAGLPLLLSCDTPCGTLDGTGSSQNGNFLYEWTTFEGNFVSDTSQLTVKVDSRGLYDLTVTNLDNGCAATSGVEVMVDETFVEICFDDDFIIPCDRDTIVVSANCSTQGTDLVYEWTTTNGNIVGENHAPSIQTDLAATYILEIRDTSNGCFAQDSLEVTALECNLSVLVSPDDTLNCLVDSVIATATIFPDMNDLMYVWTNSSGVVISDSLSAILTNEDTYTFTATNMNSGEVASDEITVFGDFEPPVADAGPDDNFDCNTATVLLDGSNSDANTSVEWISLDGHTITDPNDFQIMVSDTGVYQITVTRLENGCSATDLVAVGEDFEPPIADAGEDQQIPCSVSTASLSGENSTLSGVNIIWEPIGSGDVCAGETSANPIVCETGSYQIIVENIDNGCEARDTVVVNSATDPPPANAGQDTTLNCAITSLSLQGQGPPLGEHTVEWTHLETGMLVATDDYMPVISEAGTYQLRVTNTVTGCDSIDIVQVAIDTIMPIVNAGLADTITCMENSVQLNGMVTPPANYDLIWTSENNNFITNPTTLTPDVSIADTYTLVAFNTVNQCRDSAQVIIAADENLPMVSAGLDTALTCTITELTLTGIVEEDGLELEWTNSAGNILGTALDINITQPDTFFLTATNPMNNCAATDAVIVISNTTPPTSIITANTNQITCTVTEISLDGSNSSPSNLLYEWTRNNSPTVLSNMDTLTAELPGIYTLLVTNMENGCRHDTTFAITQDNSIPNVVIDNPQALTCLIDTVTLDATNSTGFGTTYFWTNEQGDTIGNDLTLVVNSEGDYTLTIIDNNSGCDNSEVASVITDYDLPNVVASVVNNQALDCDHTTVELTATGSSTGSDFTYLWTTTTGSFTANPQMFTTSANAAGFYILQIRNEANDCTAADTVEVIADAALITDISLMLDEAPCFGQDEATLNIENVIGGNPPFAYSLDETPFRTFPQFDYLEAGEYLLTVEDALGCQFDTLITITQPEELMVNLGEDITLQLGDSVDIEAQINLNYNTIEWSPKSLIPCQNCVIQNVRPLEQTIYTVRISDEKGCIAEDQITIFVLKDRKVYIPNAFMPDSDTPNDRFGIFTGKGVSKILSFNIFDRWGNRVFAKENYEPNDPDAFWDGTFEGKKMNTAVFGYWAEIEYVDGLVEVIKGEVVLMR